jgi:uncharacterized repeat protein (TIGR04138 family)
MSRLNGILCGNQAFWYTFVFALYAEVCPGFFIALMFDAEIARLLKEDRRYPLEGYIFVFEALHYAQTSLGMGKPGPSAASPKPSEGDLALSGEETDEPEKHVTGQELCEAIRQFALEQYGLMAKLVLGNWGIHTTGDFGEIVFNLIRIGRMRKTPHDRREDFEDVYDFDTAFRQQFKIEAPKAER